MNKQVTIEDLQALYRPSRDSHKGQNGRLLIIGGSHLFHAASLWSLTVSSRIVDLVHYSSVPENNEIVEKAKEEFRNGIVVRREDVESYIEEDDCILIGPGMTRDSETEILTNTLLKKFPQKQWVIDAGALQMLDLTVIPHNAILTPHHGEFDTLKSKVTCPHRYAKRCRRESHLPAMLRPPAMLSTRLQLCSSFGQVALRAGKALQAGKSKVILEDTSLEDQVKLFAKEYQCIVLLKGEKDIACSGGECEDTTSEVGGAFTSEVKQGAVCIPGECRIIEGGNPGMTKGGTGDVLAGLIAALACKNDPFLATIAGSFINKEAGDTLYKKVGPYFNASDLTNQIPETMKEILA